MSGVCPEGHSSESTDYCDVCGTPMAPAAPAAPAPAGPSGGGGEPKECPHCGSPAAAAALFCENCGYDFTTGTAPAGGGDGWVAAAPPSPAPSSAGGSSLELDPPAASDPGASAPSGDPAEGAPGGAPENAGEGEGAVRGEGSAPSDPGSDPDPDPTPPAGLPTPSVPGPDEWVAEVWIDPDWYAAQSPEDPIPSVGMPLVVPLRARSVLVGRPSRSRGIHPDVDCGADTGVSRRQCQLSTDGQRWWVEDLQSANGTYISPVGESLPASPIPVGTKVELEEGSRIFVGGWTRVVVRRGIPGEI